MARSFKLFCRALARIAVSEPSRLEGLRIELFGTMLGWQDGDRCHLAEVAASHGVTAWVHEDPRRVSYRRSVELLAASEGALLLGVDDPGYMPSKLYAYAFSGKPLLAVLRRGSPADVALCSGMAGADVLWFDGDDEIDAEAGGRALVAFLDSVRARRAFDRRASCEPFSARVMARRHAELFEHCVAEEARA